MIKVSVLNGPFKGKSFELEKDTVLIGRSPENDIQIIDRSVSRVHLKVLNKGGRYSVTDLKSKNGTFVNGKSITPGLPVEVKEEQPVAVGGVFISLCRSNAEEDLAALDSIDITKELDESEGVRFHDRPMTSVKNMQLLYKVADILKQSLDLNEILEQILSYILDLFKRVDRGLFILTDNKTGEITKVISLSKGTKEDVAAAYSRTVVKRVIREKKAVIMPDIFGEERDDLSESMEMLQIKSVMCVPLISKSRVWGVTYVDSIKRPHGFRQEDLSLLSALSTPAAIAIENAMLSVPEPVNRVH